MNRKLCEGTNRKGKPCGAFAIADSIFCIHHSHEIIPNRKNTRNRSLRTFISNPWFIIIFTCVIFILGVWVSYYFYQKSDNKQNEIIRLLTLSKANIDKVENLEKYAADKVNDFNRMDSIRTTNLDILNKRFPLGFALFSMDSSGVILPLNEKPKFKDITIDWGPIKFDKLTNKMFTLRMPDMFFKKDRFRVRNTFVSGARVEGAMYAGIGNQYTEPVFGILKDYSTQIVFVFAFEKINKFKKL